MVRIVLKKGYSFNFIREGICMVGGLWCLLVLWCCDDDGVLWKENVNVMLCGKCVFGFLNEVYVNNFEEDFIFFECYL